MEVSGVTSSRIDISVASSSYMFYGCTSLVCGNGTIYNSSHVDATYARVDTPSTPGYLTLKS